MSKNLIIAHVTAASLKVTSVRPTISSFVSVFFLSKNGCAPLKSDSDDSAANRPIDTFVSLTGNDDPSRARGPDYDDASTPRRYQDGVELDPYTSSRSHQALSAYIDSVSHKYAKRKGEASTSVSDASGAAIPKGQVLPLDSKGLDKIKKEGGFVKFFAPCKLSALTSEDPLILH